jgi:inosose dehydratase
VLQTARLIAAVADALPTDVHPFLVLADDNGTNPIRTQNAGRITPNMGLDDDEWRIFARGAERMARAVRAETGLRTVFHPHCAGYVETPDEIARLLDLTDPELLGLVFDTGHFTYGAGTAKITAQEGLQQFRDRIWYVHFKDCAPAVAAQARGEGWDYFRAVEHGVFCELGQGVVNFPAALEWLRENNYRGYITVEQDVLPGMGSPKASAQRNRAYLERIGL